MSVPKQLQIHGSASRHSSRSGRRSSRTSRTGTSSAGRAASTRTARRSSTSGAACQRGPGERRALARGHDGPRPLDHQGHGGDGDGARPLPPLARLRGAGLHRPARVRAERQGTNHGPPAARPSGRVVRVRREGRPHGRRGSRLAAGIMARQRPIWQLGERQAYHAISLGFYEGEIIRRVDPGHRTLGQVFDQEIAKPLGVDFYIRVPESIPDDRIAWLEPPSLWERLAGLPFKLTLAAVNPRSVVHRSLVANPGTQFYVDPQRVVARNLEAPSGGGVGTARGIARAYGVFATGGRELGLRHETIEALIAPATPARRGFFDECFGARKVLARVHEAHRNDLLRSCWRLRSAGRGWLDGLRRPRGRHRLRLRDEPDGHAPRGRSAGRCAAGGDPEPSESRGEQASLSSRGAVKMAVRRILAEDAVKAQRVLHVGRVQFQQPSDLHYRLQRHVPQILVHHVQRRQRHRLPRWITRKRTP